MQTISNSTLVASALGYKNLKHWKDANEESYLEAKSAGVLGICKENLRRKRMGRLVKRGKINKDAQLKQIILSTMRCRTVTQWEAREPLMVTLAHDNKCIDKIIEIIKSGNSRAFNALDFEYFYFKEIDVPTQEVCMELAKKYKTEAVWKKKDKRTYRYAKIHNIVIDCLLCSKSP